MVRFKRNRSPDTKKSFVAKVHGDWIYLQFYFYLLALSGFFIYRGLAWILGWE